MSKNQADFDTKYRPANAGASVTGLSKGRRAGDGGAGSRYFGGAAGGQLPSNGGQFGTMASWSG